MSNEEIERANLITSVREDEPDDVITPENQITAKSSCFDSVTSIIKKITVEPCICLYFMAMSMEGPIMPELLIMKTCLISFNYSIEICSNLSKYEEEEISVQKHANLLLMINNMIQAIPSVIFVLFLGSWSDKYGRKIPLILPFIGGTIKSAIYVLNVVFWNLPPEYFLFSAIPTAFTGGMTCLIMSIYSYISDISTRKSRTARIACLDTFLILGPTFGLLLINVAKPKLGFTGIIIVMGGLYAVSMIYILVRIEETRGPNARRDVDQELVQPKSSFRIRDIIDFDNLRETFRVTFEKRPNYGRAKILLLMISICLVVFQFSSLGKELLYVEKKLNWTMENYVYWTIAKIAFQFLGIAIIFPVLSYKVGIRDEFLALVGSLSSIIYNLCFAFAIYGYQSYIACALGWFSGVSIIISRSMTSKIVPEESSGKVFSVLGCWESIIPLLADPLYTFTYDQTVATFPGAFLCISAGFSMLTFILYIIVYKLNRNENVSVIEVNHED